MSDKERGLYRKYNVERLNDPAGKHRDCHYYVLDLIHDKHAAPALEAYAASCEAEFPDLASDLRDEARRLRDATGFTASTKRATIPIKVRPMLVSGMLATDEHGPVILIDSEQGEREQIVTLWHETLHLLGMTDEARVERFAHRLADGCPTILRSLASNINVPNSAMPLAEKQDTDWLEDELVEVMRIVAPSAQEDQITHAMLVTAIRRLMEADTEKYEALLARWQKRHGDGSQVIK